MELHQELRKWITAVIKQRSYLIRSGRSLKNSYQMAENMDHLRRRLDFFPYDSDRKISLLFQQNKARILSLLPGKGSGGHDKNQVEFAHFDQITRQILLDTPQIRISGISHGRHISLGLVSASP